MDMKFWLFALIACNCHKQVVPGDIHGNYRFTEQEVCYDDIGCFNNAYPFYDPDNGRFVSYPPEDPTKIHIQYLLYTRQNALTPQNIYKYDLSSIRQSNFDATKNTKIIVHGFLDKGTSYWIEGMTKEFLSKEPCNVIAVDWTGGNGLPYGQATANTRVVGAEIASLWTWLEFAFNASRQRLHLLGHSLGAHTVGYAAEKMPNTPHITGLDPAGPYFEFTQPQVRLDPTDALFVESIHSDGMGVIGFGFGMMTAISHFDFYPNSGEVQPGCEGLDISSIWQDGIEEGIRIIMACNHMRACDLYVDSLSESSCPYYNHQCDSWDSFTSGKCTSCAEDGLLCAKLGYNSLADYPGDASSALYRKFYSVTSAETPYCCNKRHGQSLADIFDPPCTFPDFHFYIKIELDAESKLDDVTAEFYITVCSQYGVCSSEYELTQGKTDISAGQVLEYVFALPTNISPAQRVDFRWEDSSGLFGNPYIIFKTFQITPMDERPESTRLSNVRSVCSASAGERIKPGDTATLMAYGTC